MTRSTKAARARYAFLHEIGISAATGRDGDIHVAHLRGADALFGKPLAGMAQKPHWVWTVPLLIEEHLSQHRQNEKLWWAARGFGWTDILTSPLVVALALEGFRSMDDAEGARTWLRERSNVRRLHLRDDTVDLVAAARRKGLERAIEIAVDYENAGNCDGGCGRSIRADMEAESTQ